MYSTDRTAPTLASVRIIELPSSAPRQLVPRATRAVNGGALNSLDRDLPDAGKVEHIPCHERGVPKKGRGRDDGIRELEPVLTAELRSQPGDRGIYRNERHSPEKTFNTLNVFFRESRQRENLGLHEGGDEEDFALFPSRIEPA